VNSPAASSGWQFLFLSFAAVVLLLEMLRGWRLGLMRQLVRMVGLIAAYACARWAGGAVVPFLRPLVKMPDAVLSLIGGGILAFLVYAVISTLGTVLFRRTSQHQPAAVRIVCGSSGALLGIFFGLFFIWLVFAGIRLVGSVAAAEMEAGGIRSNEMIMPIWNRPLQIKRETDSVSERGRPRPNDELAAVLAQMKRSLEKGTVGETLQQADPLPPATYRTLEKLGAVAGNGERAERFLAFPGAREIGENPKVIAVCNDPEIADLVARGRFFDLLQNQRIIDAANDPALREKIRRFDLERALDYAMQK
jgi:Colicin V production protein